MPNVSSRESLKRQAQLRLAAMTIHPTAAWHLFPPYRPITLPQYDHTLLAEQCQCRTRSHRRKDCSLDQYRRCTSCGAAYDYAGEEPPICNGCSQWKGVRDEYLGEWALQHDDRRPQALVRQPALFASQAFDFSEVPMPRWPFNWSRKERTYIGDLDSKLCTVCDNDDAPTSFIYVDEEGPVLRPVCSPCQEVANRNRLIDEGPVETIEQMTAVIGGRNRYGFDISELRVSWEDAKVNARMLHSAHGPSED